MTTTDTAVKLAKVLPVRVATVSVPDNLTQVGTFKEVVELYKETATLLSYVYESNTGDIDYDDDLGWTFTTRDINIIKYAVNYGFLDEFSTVIDTIGLAYGDQVSPEELDELVDTALDNGFRFEEMSNGNVYLILD